MRNAFESKVFDGCINGCRVLKPAGFPDPEKLKAVRRDIGLCCRCKDCRKGLGI
jgi:hypothetical protein